MVVLAGILKEFYRWLGIWKLRIADCRFRIEIRNHNPQSTMPVPLFFLPRPLSMKILTKNMHVPDLLEIAVYESLGAYQGLRKSLRDCKPNDIIEIVKKSGLRGRGGAGFPTGVKWGFVPKNAGKPIYLCVNADESEPGTFKDRLIIEKDPHQLIEGTIIAAYALDCRLAFIYIRGEFHYGAAVLEGAIEEAYAQGYLG